VQAALADASDDRGGEGVFAVGFGGRYRMEEMTMMYWGNGMALRQPADSTRRDAPAPGKVTAVEAAEEDHASLSGAPTGPLPSWVGGPARA
jgi:hypothetical protein